MIVIDRNNTKMVRSNYEKYHRVRNKNKMSVWTRSHEDYKVLLEDYYFQDLVQEILLEIFGKNETGGNKYGIGSKALRKLQDGAEDFLSKMWWHVKGFQKRHRRSNVSVNDIQHFKFMEENMFIHRLRMRRSRKTSLCDVLGKLPPTRKI